MKRAFAFLVTGSILFTSGLAVAGSASAAGYGGYMTCTSGKLVTASSMGSGVVIAQAPGVSKRVVSNGVVGTLKAYGTAQTGNWYASATNLVGTGNWCR